MSDFDLQMNLIYYLPVELPKNPVELFENPVELFENPVELFENPVELLENLHFLQELNFMFV